MKPNGRPGPYSTHSSQSHKGWGSCLQPMANGQWFGEVPTAFSDRCQMDQAEEARLQKYPIACWKRCVSTLHQASQGLSCLAIDRRSKKEKAVMTPPRDTGGGTARDFVIFKMHRIMVGITIKRIDRGGGGRRVSRRVSITLMYLPIPAMRRGVGERRPLSQQGSSRAGNTAVS